MSDPARVLRRAGSPLPTPPLATMSLYRRHHPRIAAPAVRLPEGDCGVELALEFADRHRRNGARLHPTDRGGRFGPVAGLP